MTSPAPAADDETFPVAENAAEIPQAQAVAETTAETDAPAAADPGAEGGEAVSEIDQAPAWRLSLGDGYHLAVGEREMIHLIQNPTLLAIPHAPRYCRQVAIWQGEVLPVFDVAAWLTGQTARDTVTLLGVVVFSDGDTVQRGGVVLDGIPARTLVADHQQAPLPDARWEPVALSCFAEDDLVYPIVALEALFTPPATTVPSAN